MIDFHFYRFIDLSMAYISIMNYCKLIQLDSGLFLRHHRYLILSRNVFDFRGRNTHRFVRKRQKSKNASLISNLSFETERIIRLFHMRSHQLLLYFLRVRDAGRNCNEIIHFPL